MDPYDIVTTAPERVETLRHQQDQLIAGRRLAMMFPASEDGTPYRVLPLPQGMAEVEVPRVGTFHINPDYIGAGDIAAAVRTGSLNALLNLGPFSKSEIADRVCRGEHPVAVVEMAPDGHEVRAAWGTLETARQQLLYFNLTATPGHECFVTSPLHVIAARTAAPKS
jgi:hypothetical protein